MKKRCLVLTGGGDCPGLNAVIRAVVKRASKEPDWEIVGSKDAFNGVFSEPMNLMILNDENVAGIHVRGGTILGTTNKGGPFGWKITDENGNPKIIDRSKELVEKIKLNFDAVISIGGDGSMTIAQKLFEMGCNIVGVPKTIDKDLDATDLTFGFMTAVQTATDALDKLVTTAESHHRVMIMEVMGREAGWIALYTAIAGGAEVCLIPEIPYNINKIKEKIEERIYGKGGFANIVIAEGAFPQEYGKISPDDLSLRNKSFGGAGGKLMNQLKEVCPDIDFRTTVLGHLQRGGSPNAFDRILATEFGVKAFELVLEGKFGEMVAYKNSKIKSVPIIQAIQKFSLVKPHSQMVKIAKDIGICFGN